MTEHTSTQIAHREAGADEYGNAFEAFLEAQEGATGRDLMDEDLDQDELFREFESHYRGEWTSAKTFAMEVVCDELGLNGVGAQYCDQLAAYLNWDMITEGMFRHGNFTFVDGYVFEDEV